LRAHQCCSAAEDGFGAADVILEEDVFIGHPFVSCARGDNAHAVCVDVGDMISIGFDDEDGDVYIKDVGDVHCDGVDEIFEALCF